jgi:hypothetical protein
VSGLPFALAWLTEQRPNAVPEPSQNAGNSPFAATKRRMFMTAQSLICLIEEMMDLKVRQYAESQMKLTPEVAPLLREKRETDKKRLEQIKRELVRFLET